MTYVLIDTNSSRVVGQNLVKSDFYRGELESGRGPRSESTVFARLARQVGERVAGELAPHETVVEVTLAPGGGDVRDGIAAAKEGDWQKAKQHWSAAVQADTEDHAALYNLGLACEATGDLPGARHCYETALKLKDKGTYQRTLDRLKRTEADVRLAWSQKSRATAQLAAATTSHREFSPAAQPAAHPMGHPPARPAAHPAEQPAARPSAPPAAHPGAYRAARPPAHPAAHVNAHPGAHSPAHPAANASQHAPPAAPAEGPGWWEYPQTQ
jgi:tetratricopeptide (TPR) repeat protein